MRVRIKKTRRILDEEVECVTHEKKMGIYTEVGDDMILGLY